ncbi:hypothetical protein SDC9_146598 [bioreactor metagenome]|uniref:Uncharacterized protein n=1 Tax=bioreactor metagenome TaxID=1076179 RepID=A0A645EBQ3_9ZZZZ
MLSGNHDCINADRSSVRGILNGNLRFGIGTEVGHQFQFVFPDVSQFAQQCVAQIQCQRHIVIGFRCCITKHHPLITGALVHRVCFAVNPPVYVVGLFVDARKNTTRFSFKLVFAFGVADTGNNLTRHLSNIHIRI